jgi:hypothetical protein
VNGEELYLVAGKGDDLRLWSLDRRTGTPNWSQLIAYSDTKINLDIVRRWITSQVAAGDGVIVCPTTVGWLVAIDQTRQSVLWAYRYAPPAAQEKNEREAGTMLLPQKELNAQWCPSAPIISENRVVFTPQDEDMLICLNTADGQKIWEKAKGTGIYLAGIFEQKVVIVGENGVTAFHLPNGEIAWSTKFEDGVRVSGRGVAVGDHYYLPLSNGGLQTIDLTAGQVQSQTYVGSRQPPLGNLAMHHGKLVSLGPNGLTAFGQCDAVLNEIQQRLAANPRDGGALLRSSEIQLLNRKYRESLSLLRQIPVEQLTSAEQDRQHAALVECLSTLIHGDILHCAGELEELGRVAVSSADRLLHRELTAEKLLAEQKPVEAFDVLWQLAEQDGDAFVLRDDDRHVSVRRDVWLGGRISEIWSTAMDADRILIDERIKSLIAEAADRDPVNYQRLISLLNFHPESIVAQERFVERLVQAGDPGGARIMLQQLFDNPDKSVAARATVRLARMMAERQLINDAVYYYRLLESKFADVIVHDGQTGAVLAAGARAVSEQSFEPKPKGVLWKASPMRLEHSVLNYLPPPQDVVCDTPLPFFNRLSFESFASEQRLSMESLETGKVEWMMPLRGAVRVNDDGFVSTSLIGHQMFFISRGTLHAVSPIDKRILWVKPIEEPIDTNLHLRHDSRSTVTTMVSPHTDESSSSLLMQQAFSSGQLAVVQPHYLCLQGRRSLTVLNPRTGAELWKMDGLPIYAQIVGNRDALFVISPGKNEIHAYRVTDGKTLKIPELARLLNNALLTQGSSLLLFEQGGLNPSGAPITKRARNSKCSLRLFDPVAQTTTWQREFPAGTVASPLGQDEVVVAQPDWQIRRIDVGTGQISALEAPFAEAIPSSKSGLFLEKYLLADDDRIYLIVNRVDADRNTSPEGLASIHVNGWIFAWNRQDNRLLWHNAITSQNLVVDRFSKLPVLLFVSRSWRHRGRMNMNGSLIVAAIHKQTGQTLINKKEPAAYSAFHAMSFNAEDHSIELKSYNLRLRLVPTDESLPPEIKTPALDPTKP